jgi:hypothetical protein
MLGHAKGLSRVSAKRSIFLELLAGLKPPKKRQDRLNVPDVGAARRDTWGQIERQTSREANKCGNEGSRKSLWVKVF